MRFVANIAAAVLMAFSAPSVGFAQERTTDYRLGPDDKVKVSVFEWRSARNEVYEWAALNGEFVINSSGMLSLPLIGEVKASDLRTGDLANVISDRLQAKVGFAQRPDTAIEIVQYRPFYIIGAVNKPGDYPYRPGMSVLQAVGVAGGFYRSGELGLSRFERETIASNGDLRVIAVEHLAMLGRAARLQAELSGANAISFPPEIVENGNRTSSAQIIREESELFRSRRETLRSQLDALAQAKVLVQREVEGLRSKDETQDRQLSLARRELDNVNTLVAKGLAVAPRQLALEQALAQIESARQDLNLSIIRAEQEIAKIERNIIDLRNQRQNEVLAELRLAQTKLQEYQERAETAQRLVYESDVVAPRLEAERAREQMLQPVFLIVRNGPDGISETTVTQTATVQPGDIIKVERPTLPSQFSGNPLRSERGRSGGPQAQAPEKSAPAMPTFSMPTASAQNALALPGLTWPTVGSPASPSPSR